MKSFYATSIMATSALILEAKAQVSYNANMQYFIADLGPTSPCHPLYDRGYTWVTTSNN